MSYFKLVTILGLLILLVFVFYLNNKNKLEVERQHQESLQREVESQLLEKEKQDQIKAQEIKATEVKKVAIPVKNTAVEIEKCKYKYVVAREYDSREDAEYILYQVNYAIKHQENLEVPLDSTSLLKALQDDYFYKKY